ncbi:1,6-anhydro-N-acetylmuramyl-L-alanine amidase AmpD [Vibrio genomosp. F10]|uniref:1,6-anhydro-N-acetylmuramyl-L-alanine amidase AmpD n=2 Tax=Vibrio genomosp. F10 TaxID=723171 RepID=A0A1B9QU82_9VIBR|nr:1,6-anhydro-N-acetylmuramyl-L-alanine amidase AmpD [Vibrio genomosp. F10]OCH70065.1 N-acetyl-anhydromuranmyl-L-alanine amidase [Vibrio genomosp. F10]OEE37800.1 N-acetyl-anhydromuranmyl-L-alanine amidase [Vibrio genomosp. F10 str. ZF-129]OEE95797.1 N-acetyl-anhydromuranmyl-L-alanine amidase [Vibrio genomosp. F10 str. 9ZD137]OEE96745.1 N-acetyl-anhydromuranmyl-L-alanine amidase [Vibrio genomosp. F10 str. 9ZC157]
MIDQQGWYAKAKSLPSPHCDHREDPSDISLLVIHNISLPPSQFGGGYIEQFFTGKLDASHHPFFKVIENMRVSAHCLIDREGKVIQFVPFQQRAWHAGVSSFAGRSKCNDYSIGIELEGDDYSAYTEAQYQSLALLTKELMKSYPNITKQRITGHQYIAPLRKTDPGLSFDWRKLAALINTP